MRVLPACGCNPVGSKNTRGVGMTSVTVLWPSSVGLVETGGPMFEQSEAFANWRADGTGVLEQADRA